MKAWLLVLFVIAGSRVAHAQFSMAPRTANAVVDSNNCATVGPRAMFLQIDIANTSGATRTNVVANLVGFSGALGTGESATRTVGTMAAGATVSLYWYVKYSCSLTVHDNYSVSVTSDTTPVTSPTMTLTHRSSIAANAGGIVLSVAVDTSAQTVYSMTVQYGFGGAATGDNFMFQPAGNPTFEAGCFRLLDTRITQSTIQGLPVNTNIPLAVTTTSSTPGSGHTVSVRYRFTPRCATKGTTFEPFSEQSSGSASKYTGSYPTCPSGSTCAFPPGPSVCGDGAITGGETCDDGDALGGDGCSASCAREVGYTCTGQPSTCTPTCGDGRIVGNETCDDNDRDAGDGCSASCATEGGYRCTGMPSVCAPLCGDGSVVGSETCDDGAAVPGDGCSATCATESGYACAGTPSVCAPVCGDGSAVGNETCDDGATASGDGCSATCATEDGYACSGTPSTCEPTCGDGILVGAETCDDNNATAGDGCSEACTIEPGFGCDGVPSTCAPSCGDSTVTGTEECDDGNMTPDDGCSATCKTEPGFVCTSTSCEPTCGDGVVAGSETCDDQNAASGDGCSSTCSIEDDDDDGDDSGGCCSSNPRDVSSWFAPFVLLFALRRRRR